MYGLPFDVPVPVIFDIETNAKELDDVEVVWCSAVKFPTMGNGKVINITETEELADYLSQATHIIGHNIVGYDLPVLKKLGIYDISDTQWMIDTLIWSRTQCPDRTSHSLDAWGKDLGCLKGDFKDFSKFSQKMMDYCNQDVVVTDLVLQNLCKGYWGALK